jgi:hypothetical protein
MMPTVDSSDLDFVLPGTLVNSSAGGSAVVGHRTEGNRGGRRLYVGMPSEDWHFVMLAPPEVHGSAGTSGLYAESEVADETFAREKTFFDSLPPDALSAFQGHYVAVYGQRIIDSDYDLYSLTRRFFSKHGPVPVYITFVGEEPALFIPGPVILGPQ